MKEHILVIDDDQAVRDSFTLALEDSSVTVDLAESGEEGVARFQRGKYHVVFLDLKMPGLSGVETLRRIRKVDADVPVYIVTAFHKEFFQELSCASFEGLDFQVLRKPIGREEIITVVQAVLVGTGVY